MSSLSINSNVSALNAQRRLGQSTRDLQDSFTRLSSGLRINRTADDAAGLSISESLKADRRVLAQGVRNLNDGIALLSIADSAISELSGITIRLVELAEQTANGALANTQREALDEEAQALRDEFSRIVQSTEFNDRQLFSASFGELRLQADFGTNGGIQSGLGGHVGTGSFAPRVSFASGNTPRFVSSGDFNSDGVLDLVTTDGLSNTASVLLGDGTGSFGSRRSFATGSSPRSVSIGDFNGDGVLDLATAESSSGTASILLGDGSGSFGPRRSFATGSTPYSLTTGDFNGDGVLDLATVDYLSDRANVLLGDGTGSFGPRRSFATGSAPRSVSTGDFNGDGVLDLVTADDGSDAVSVLLGDGTGSFGPRRSFAVGTGPFSVATGDFNGDGVPDLVTADSFSDTASVLLGDGTGSFGPRRSFATGDNPYSVAIGDFNGDGVLDLGTADNSSSTASILLGDGTGSFGTRRSFATGSAPHFLSAGDFNGDGVLDLVSADSGANTASVLLGQTTTGVSPLLDFSLTTTADARQALPVFKRKFEQLTAQRAQIGAFESRISTAIATTTIAGENVAAAGSRITDADLASESARLVRNQILQQAGVAVLSQANLQPQISLQLLQSV